ncbi:MAG: PrsW family intramembrane metalloprotease, partial [Anaerolineae bacterium]
QSQQRRWGLVAAGLGGGPFLSILAEITLALLAVGGVAVWAGQNPQAASTLETMGKRLLFAAGNPAAARRALTHILETYPLLRLAGLTALGVFIPLVEEFFKPLGVWMLSRKGISPQEGLFSGMLSGGMFALMESVLSRAQGDSWLVTLSGRAGTSLMHIATAGLVGYALARAWQERRYLHLGASYLLAVLLHGAWNISVINFSGNVFFNDNSLQWNATTISSVLTLAIVLLISLWIVLQLGTPQASPLPVQEETHGLD